VAKKKFSTQYVGPLTAKEIAGGMNAARENAQRLYEDAESLFKAKRYPSACALAVLSIEESGKPSILRRMGSTADPAQLKALWREYRTHTAKNRLWIIGDLARAGARTIGDMKRIVDQDSDHPELLDYIKQLSFYSDCYIREEWATPEAIVDREMTQGIMRAAKALLGKKRKHTQREIELWVEHVGAATDGPESAPGVLKFYEAMIAEGLEDTSIENVRAFLGMSPKH
jgi:AbiV family abortive infection protein